MRTRRLAYDLVGCGSKETVQWIPTVDANDDEVAVLTSGPFQNLHVRLAFFTRVAACDLGIESGMSDSRRLLALLGVTAKLGQRKPLPGWQILDMGRRRLLPRPLEHM